MRDRVIPRSDFTGDERVEIRSFFIGLRHRRWLWSRLKIWLKWVGGLGASALAVAHWANDFGAAALKVIATVIMIVKSIP